MCDVRAKDLLLVELLCCIILNLPNHTFDFLLIDFASLLVLHRGKRIGVHFDFETLFVVHKEDKSYYNSFVLLLLIFSRGRMENGV